MRLSVLVRRRANGRHLPSMIVETRQSAVRRGHPGKQQRQPNAPSDRVFLPLRLGLNEMSFSMEEADHQPNGAV